MFNKKIIIPLILVLALLGVLFAVTLIDTQNEEPVVQSDSGDVSYEIKYVFDIDLDSINNISVTYSGENFIFEKNEGTWNISGNSNASVSSGSISSLASSIAGLSYSEVISDGSISQTDCGIDETSDIVVFTSNLGEVTLKKGMTTTDNTLCYIVTSLSQDVYLCEVNDCDRIFAPLTQYRNSASVNLDFESIVSVSYSGKEKMELVKQQADTKNAVYNQWRLTSPVTIGANDEAVKLKFIDSLERIIIDDFASDDGDYENYGIGSRENYIRLTDSYGKSSTVYFSYETNGKYYISVDDKPAIYEISPVNAPYINIGVIDIADRNINLVKMTNIEKVVLHSAEKEYIIEFLQNSGNINGSEISYDILNQEIFPAVCGIMADDIYTGSAGNEVENITYFYKDGTSDILSFSTHNDRYYIVSKNGTAGYLVLKNKVEDLKAIMDKHIK